MDCVRSDQFFGLIKRGLMPNFKNLMENGIYSKNCITDFPSVTYPTQVSMITGTYTGDFRKEFCHGVPLSHWMDRRNIPPITRSYSSDSFQIYQINDDLGPNCKTILEMIDEGNKASILQYINRGTDYFFPENKLKLIIYYLLSKYSRNLNRKIARINTVSIFKLLDTFKNPKKYFFTREPPICSLLYLFTPDVLMHSFGNKSQIYKANLLHLDKLFGILIDKLTKLGYMEDTVIAIASDHGNYKAKRYGDLTPFFSQNAFIDYHSKRKKNSNINIEEFGSAGFMYFKGQGNNNQKNGWNYPKLKDLKRYGPKRTNLFKELFKIEGVSLMYFREDENSHKKGVIHLKAKDCKTNKIHSGWIEYIGNGSNQKTKYIMDDDNRDIFGYMEDNKTTKLIDDKFHTIDEWLASSFHLDYPLYPDLLPRHFKNPRSSDIIVSTKGEVIFNYEKGSQKHNNLNSHDIGLRSCSVVPLIISGSNEIPHKELDYCKITDIVPTLLRLIGKKPHKSVIGNCLV
ncbi:MAG: alkaline phosphatase family protein [Candidatus Hermodarchaeota archaeon]